MAAGHGGRANVGLLQRPSWRSEGTQRRDTTGFVSRHRRAARAPDHGLGRGGDDLGSDVWMWYHTLGFSVFQGCTRGKAHELPEKIVQGGLSDQVSNKNKFQHGPRSQSATFASTPTRENPVKRLAEKRQFKWSAGSLRLRTCALLAAPSPLLNAHLIILHFSTSLLEQDQCIEIPIQAYRVVILDVVIELLPGGR